ncbi:MAG: glycosyltransferase family 2 protein [Candidatus Micrarchaeia archaeon]
MVTLSIIIPILNEEKNLACFLENYKSQTKKADELIFVDGGSKDNSINYLRENQKTFPEIKIYNCKKKGPAAARNYGLEKAKSQYVIFMDADWRLLDRSVLHKIYEIIKANPKVDFIGIGISYRPIKKLVNFSYLRKLIYYRDEPFSFHIIKKNICPRYDESLGYGEDKLFSKELYHNKKYISLTKNIGVSRAIGDMNFYKFCRRYVWYGRTIPYYIIKTKDFKLLLASIISVISIIPVLWIIPFLKGLLTGIRYIKDGMDIPLGLGLLEIIVTYCVILGYLQWIFGIREISRDL